MLLVSHFGGVKQKLDFEEGRRKRKKKSWEVKRGRKTDLPFGLFLVD